MTQIMLTPPASEPVSLSDAKAWLRVDSTAEDNLISTLIVSARLVVEQATRRFLLTQTWRILPDGWPSDVSLDLPIGPLQSIDAIRVRDASGVAHNVDPATYVADAKREPARIVFSSPPAMPTYPANGVEIDVTAGYGTTSDSVPQPLRQAMLMLIAGWHDNRGDVVFDPNGVLLPAPVAALVAPYRRARLI